MTAPADTRAAVIASLARDEDSATVIIISNIPRGDVAGVIERLFPRGFELLQVNPKEGDDDENTADRRGAGSRGGDDLGRACGRAPGDRPIDPPTPGAAAPAAACDDQPGTAIEAPDAPQPAPPQTVVAREPAPLRATPTVVTHRRIDPAPAEPARPAVKTVLGAPAPAPTLRFRSWIESFQPEKAAPAALPPASERVDDRRERLERQARGPKNAVANAARRTLVEMAAREARQADPLEPARDFLRKRGLAVYGAAVVGGPKHRWVVGSAATQLDAEELLRYAEQRGYKAAAA